MVRYVVAGATGHVGSVVARELLAQGEKISVIVRDAARGGPWAARGAEVAVGSLDDARFLSGALRGAEAFLALLPETPTAPDMHAARRRMVDAIAAAVRENRVPRVVMISSLGADLAGGNGPIGDLHDLEHALRATGTGVRAIRSSYYQENVAGMLPAAEQAGVYPNFMPSADVAFPTTATRDVGHLAARLLASTPAATEVVDLVGPMYSVRQLAEALGTAIGRRLQVVGSSCRPGPGARAGRPVAVRRRGLRRDVRVSRRGSHHGERGSPRAGDHHDRPGAPVAGGASARMNESLGFFGF